MIRAMEDPKALGRTIQSLRLNLGLSQAELAKRVGVKAPTIYRHENGSRPPDARELSRLLRALCVTWEEFQGHYDALERYRLRDQSGGTWWKPAPPGTKEAEKQVRLEEEAADAFASAARLALVAIFKKLDRHG